MAMATIWSLMELSEDEYEMMLMLENMQKKLSSDVMMLILENMQRKLSSDMVQLVLWCTKGGITLANLNQIKFQVIHEKDKDDYLVQDY